MRKYDTQAPYIASYLIIKKDGKIPFVLRENTGWMNGYYGLASGKVEKGESFTEAIVREAKEEIGIEVKPADLKPIHSMHRHEKGPEGLDWVDVFFEATSWKGEPHNAEPHLHSELVWHDPSNLPENVIPSVRAALQAIIAGKTYSEFGWES